jgi:DNA-binding PadR family transcriptional regulator
LEPGGLVIEAQSLKLLQNIGFVTKSLEGDTVMSPAAAFSLTPEGQAAYERLRGDPGTTASFSKS